MTVKNVILILFGFILLSLGTIGIFFPVLPTTPFVIGAAACFSCAPKLRTWLMRIPVFNKYIENYKYGTGLPKKTVIVSLVYLWVTLLVSCILTMSVWITLLLGFIGIIVTVHILMISKPRNNRMVKNNENT